MIKASEIREQVEEVKKSYEEIKKAEEIKRKNDMINSEMLEVEKALNEFRRNIATKGVKAIKPT